MNSSPGSRMLQIGLENLVDGICHLVAGKARTEDGADRRVLGGGAAKRDLVEFLALLVEAEDADVADMMVAAGVDAARDVDLDLADLVLLRPMSANLREIDWATGIERAVASAQ